MFSRRDFLRNGVCAAVAGVIPGGKSAESFSPLPSAYFGLHPFIEANPKAVFIRRTRVPSITDEEAKRREGLTLAREIFVSTDRPGHSPFRPGYLEAECALH